MCKVGEPGYEDCFKKRAFCRDDDSEAGYKCECPIGTTMLLDNGTCQDWCTVKGKHESCKTIFAECKVTNYENKTVDCACPYSMTMEEGGCKFGNRFAFITLTIYNKYDFPVYMDGSGSSTNKWFSPPEFSLPNAANIINYPKLQEDLRESMVQLYGFNLQQANIFNCSMGYLIDCQVEIQLNDTFNEAEKVFKRNTSCEDVQNDEKFCVFPPRLIVLRESQTKAQFVEKNLCEDPLLNHCQESTDCKYDPPGYSCQCKKGYKMLHSLPFTAEEKYKMEICADVNECENRDTCHNTSQCKNTIGSFKCECASGYLPVNGVDNIRTNGCKHVCQDLSCGENGNCAVIQDNKPACVCHEGYHGVKCEMKRKYAEVQTVIVGAVLGSLFFLTLMALIVLLIRRRKQTVPNSVAVEMPMVRLDNRNAEMNVSGRNGQMESYPSPIMLPRASKRSLYPGEDNAVYKECY